MDIIKPFMKWVGGKTQIIQDIMDTFPPHVENYIEPFIGGGSVLLAFLSYVENGMIVLKGKVQASDKNPRLIAVYKNIQQNPEELLNELTQLVTTYNECNSGKVVIRKPVDINEAKTSQESWYYWIRSCYNSLPETEQSSARAAAMFIFLNKTCFRGVYREGPNGFNVPFGHYANPSVVDETHIWLVSYLIRDVVFTCCSFEDALNLAKPGDFVYVDPPYAPETSKSFVGYTTDGFDMQLHKNLFDACHGMSNKKIRFVMSNADVDLVRNNFPVDKYDIRVIECKRAINSKKPSSKTNEVIIKNTT